MKNKKNKDKKSYGRADLNRLWKQMTGESLTWAKPKTEEQKSTTSYGPRDLERLWKEATGETLKWANTEKGEGQEETQEWEITFRKKKKE